MRVAMWSILNRFASRSVSCSPCSSSSMSRIWRSTRDWLRQDRSTNISSSLPRSPASLAASRSTSACIWSKARATSPISSEDDTGMPWTSPTGPSPPGVMRRSASGSRTSASSTAPACSWRSGRSTDRVKTIADATPTARTANAKMPCRHRRYHCPVAHRADARMERGAAQGVGRADDADRDQDGGNRRDHRQQGQAGADQPDRMDAAGAVPRPRRSSCGVRAAACERGKIAVATARGSPKVACPAPYDRSPTGSCGLSLAVLKKSAPTRMMTASTRTARMISTGIATHPWPMAGSVRAIPRMARCNGTDSAAEWAWHTFLQSISREAHGRAGTTLVGNWLAHADSHFVG